MKKVLFLIFSLSLLIITTKAADQYPDPTVSNSLASAVAAVGDGETVYLDDAAPYDNVKDRDGQGHGDDYTKLAKNFTIKAIAGKHPVIKFEVPIQVREGASVKIIGVEFDGTNLSSYDAFIYFKDNANNELELENCEFHTISKYGVSVPSGSKASSLVVKNCNFHNCSNRGIINQGTIESLVISGSQFKYFTGNHVIDNYGSGSIESLQISGCEFANNSYPSLHQASGASIAACTINKCYFHDNTRGCIFSEATTSSDMVLTVSNSTFENINPNSPEKYYAATIDARSSAAQLIVDHCTFYNCETANTDFGAIGYRTNTWTDITISNCIFAMPESYSNGRAIYVPAGQVKNCLTFNYTKDSTPHGIHSGPTITNCAEADPQFTNAANSDFSFQSNWITMNLSPVCGAATDGSDLGDPRWHNPVCASVDLSAAGYVFAPEKAKLTGNIVYETGAPSPQTPYIRYDHSSKTGNATWKINATAPCYVSTTVNMADNTWNYDESDNTRKYFQNHKHIFVVQVYDSNNNLVGSVQEGEYNEDGSSDGYSTYPTVNLPGSIHISEAGIYTIRLLNPRNESRCGVDNVTFTYAGGATKEIPTNTLTAADALISSKGSRADGMISYTSYSDSWAKWNVVVAGTEKKAYSFTLNINNPTAYGHNFSISIYEDEAEDPIATLSEHEWNQTYGTPLALLLGTALLEGGKNYVVKVTNAESGAQPKIISVDVAYSGGNVINVSPSTNTVLPTADAWFTNSCTRNASGITYSSDNANAWIKWNIATSETAFYDVTVNINTTQAHQFAVNIYEDESAAPVATVAENGYTSSTGSPLALALGRINLAGGKNYVVKVTNVTSGSEAQVIDVTFAPVVTTVITIPETLLPGDAILSDRAWVDNDSLLFTARGDEGYNSSQWAKWQIMSEEQAKYKFTLHAFNAAPEGQGQKFAITILSEDESSQIATITSDWMDVGARTVVLSNVGLSVGNYIVKVEEPLWGATGRVLSIEVEREAITIDEAATSSTTNLGEYDTYMVDANLVRTLVGGMYNTICLPFAVSAAEKTRVFGSAKVKELTDSSIESDGFVLNLNFEEVNEMAAGVPYLIKPAADIVNPTFLGVTIANTLNNSETDVVDFIGNFVVSEVPEGRNNYFLSADNKLYYSNSATAINGMRGYFALDNSVSNAPTRARIIEAQNVVTEIDLVNGGMPETFGNTSKLIENGQLILIRDGIRYNALGVRIK